MQQSILLETTTYCNLNCSFCYRGEDKHSEIYNSLSLEKVKELFDRNSDYMDVSLVNKGEFFIHPQCMEIFDYVIEEAYNNSKVKLVFLYSNGTLMKKEYIDRMFNTLKKYPVNFSLNFSLNAVKPETYQKLSGKNLLGQAIKNIKYFIENLKENKKLEENVNVTVQSLVLRENTEELDDFIIYWDNFFKEKNLKYIICEDSFRSDSTYKIGLKRVYTGNKDDFTFYLKIIQKLSEKWDIHINDNIETGENHFKRAACDYLFNQPVSSDEWVTICCRDLYFKHKYKKPEQKESILEDYFKTSHFTGNFENISLCHDCLNYVKLENEKVREHVSSEKVYSMYNRRLETGVPFDIYYVRADKEKDKKSACEFLDNNNIKTLVADIEHKNAYYKGDFTFNGRSEEDFCIKWTGNLEFKEGKIYSGCEKQKIQIEDYNKFSSKLKNGDYSDIPEKCLLCQYKISEKPLQDRYRVFGDKGFHRAFFKTGEYFQNLSLLKESLKENNIEISLRCMDYTDSFILYSEFIKGLRKYERDNEKFGDLFIQTNDIFLISEYALFTEEFYEKSLLYLKNKLKKDFFPFIKLKLIKYLFENKLKNPELSEYTENLVYNILNNQNDSEIFNDKKVFEEFIILFIKRIDKIKNPDEFIYILEKTYRFHKELKNILRFKICEFFKLKDSEKIREIILKYDTLNPFVFENVEDYNIEIIQRLIENIDTIDSLDEIIQKSDSLLEEERIISSLSISLAEFVKKGFSGKVLKILEKNKIKSAPDIKESRTLVENVFIRKDFKNADEIRHFIKSYLYIFEKSEIFDELIYIFRDFMKSGEAEIVRDIIKEFGIEERISNKFPQFRDDLYIHIISDGKLEIIERDFEKEYPDKVLIHLRDHIISRLSVESAIKYLDFCLRIKIFNISDSDNKHYDFSRNILNSMINFKNKHQYLNYEIFNLLCQNKCFSQSKESEAYNFSSYVLRELFEKSDNIILKELEVKSYLENYEKDNIYYLLFNKLTQEIKEILQKRKFYTFYKNIKEYKDEFINKDLIAFDYIMEYPFELFSWRFIKFLYMLSRIKDPDMMYYKMFSYLIHIENFNNAFKCFENVKNKNRFWHDNEIKKTIEFLEKNMNFSANFKKRIFSFFK